MFAYRGGSQGKICWFQALFLSFANTYSPTITLSSNYLPFNSIIATRAAISRISLLPLHMGPRNTRSSARRSKPSGLHQWGRMSMPSSTSSEINLVSNISRRWVGGPSPLCGDAASADAPHCVLLSRFILWRLQCHRAGRFDPSRNFPWPGDSGWSRGAGLERHIRQCRGLWLAGPGGKATQGGRTLSLNAGTHPREVSHFPFPMSVFRGRIAVE